MTIGEFLADSRKNSRNRKPKQPPKIKSAPVSYLPEYQVWCDMKQRCYNPKRKNFHRYGGRGIKVCKRWRKSFLAFLEDMGLRPTDKHSIERKDNDKGYFPANCCWATWKEQQNNKCNSFRCISDQK